MLMLERLMEVEQVTRVRQSEPHESTACSLWPLHVHPATTAPLPAIVFSCGLATFHCDFVEMVTARVSRVAGGMRPRQGTFNEALFASVFSRLSMGRRLSMPSGLFSWGCSCSPRSYSKRKDIRERHSDEHEGAGKRTPRTRTTTTPTTTATTGTTTATTETTTTPTTPSAQGTRDSATTFKRSPPVYDYHALVVGLGNPGKEFERTRHNAGFMFLDVIAKEHRLQFKKFSHQGASSNCWCGWVDVCLSPRLSGKWPIECDTIRTGEHVHLNIVAQFVGVIMCESRVAG
eukprot:TRINITY_DN5186_c0_g1_i2.p1 TRINITY_DN5186_c0_g1~~TRINITY_DN5186_c0_g1_i2.p1  ORF type:complete len:289 (+),score=23.89 TRINITY_DN5186_c0_g1_i2:47-913(+)